jgi:hypothetical protein
MHIKHHVSCVFGSPNPIFRKVLISLKAVLPFAWFIKNVTPANGEGML